MNLRDELERSLGDAYRLGRELGGGGMSRVFIAEEVRLSREVVVKVLTPELAAGINAERFEREIQLAAHLQHPHVVPVLSAGDAAGLPYFTMPFVEGDSLRALIARDGALPIPRVISILRDVAKALDYAHSKAVVHRDIKPDNILVTGGSATVADFGIAKAISASRTESGGGGTLTTIGTSLGTPAYMAPEQAAGDPDTDHRADIYAFGCTAYEMLTGAPPFGNRAPHQAIVAHMTEAVAPVATKRRDVPAPLASLVMRSLEKDPARRPQAASEILAVLDSVGTGAGYAVASPPRRRWLVGAGALAVVASVMSAAYVWRSRGSTPGAAAVDTSPSVAVLPLQNASGDTRVDYFADGMTDELTVALQKLPGIRVAARTSVFALRDKRLPVDSLARLLNVRNVLAGSVRRDGVRLRVTAELTSAHDGKVLWSDRFERQAKDVFSVQDDITSAIVGALRVQLGQGAHAGALRGTSDLEAYDLYLKGLFNFQKRGPDAMTRAATYFTSATQRDSTFARAWAGLANVLSQLPSWTGAKVDSITPPARRAAERAIALDGSLAEPHAVLATLSRYEWKWAESEAEFKRAIALDSTSATALQWYAEMLYGIGRLDEAIALLRRAHAVDPAYPTPWITLAHCLGVARKYDEALAILRQAKELDPANPLGPFVEGNLYLGMGRNREANEDLTRARAVIGLVDVKGDQFVVLKRLGDVAAADSIRRELERDPNVPGVPATLAIAYSALGDTARALDWLERAAAARDFKLLRDGLRAPAFDAVRQTIRFRGVLRTMGLDEALNTTIPK